MDYEKENIVSIWVGSFSSERVFKRYISYEYDDDGNAMCPFAIEQEIDWFEEDFVEAEYFKKGIKMLPHLLEGFSYVSSFQEKALAAIGSQLQSSDNSLLLITPVQDNCFGLR
jgi:hypothetical protein